MAFGIHQLENRDWTFKKSITVEEDLTVEGDFTFGDASTDALTITGDLTVNNEDAEFIYTDDGATGFQLNLKQVSASPAAEDAVGVINFIGKDDGGNDATYATLRTLISDPTDGSEKGDIVFEPAGAGLFVNRVTDDGAVGAVFAGVQESTSPAINDAVCVLNGTGKDDGGNDNEYGAVAVAIGDPTDGSEVGIIGLFANTAGSMQTIPNLAVLPSESEVTYQDDGAAGPNFNITHLTTTPAVSDVVGTLSFFSYDDGGNKEFYGRIKSTILSTTDGSEEGDLRLSVPDTAGGEFEAVVVGFGTTTVKNGLAHSPYELTSDTAGVAANLQYAVQLITTDGDSNLDNVTLADGEDGQIMDFAVVAVGNAADSVKITPANMIGGSIITFAANPLGLGCRMVFSATAGGWCVIANNGGTIS